VRKPVYVYHDEDHNDVELFSSLEQAKSWAEQHWPNEDGDLEWGLSGSKRPTWSWGEYVTIYEKKIRQENV